MMRCITHVSLAICGLLLMPWCAAEIPLDDEGRFAAFGDFRTRAEQDWDSRNSDGSKRDDRARLRIRARLGLNFHISDSWLAQLRVATGADDNQQSTTTTIIDFNGNSTGDSHINFDRYFIKKDFGKGHAWVGRNLMPFWRQNESFWDNDAPVTGIAFNYKIPLNESRLMNDSSLMFNTGYFMLPVGMRDTAGNLAIGQVVYKTKTNNIDWTLAGGVLLFDADPGDSDADRLLDNNGSRDYTLWVTSAQARFDWAARPLILGFDYIHNSKDYDSVGVNAFTALHRNETDAWHVQALLGDTKNKWDWKTGVIYSRVETFGVHNSYSQDDSVRWGANNQTRASNFEGTELHFGIGLGHQQVLLARLYLVDAMEKHATTDVSKEDGNRFRVDYTISF